MTFSQDDIYITHQLIVGDGFPTNILKLGPEEVRGAASIEGPVVMGSPNTWVNYTATVMIGPDTNLDSDTPSYPGAINALGSWNHSPYSLHVVGDAIVNDHLDVNLDVNAGGSIRSGSNIHAQIDITAENNVIAKNTSSAQNLMFCNGDVVAYADSLFPHSLAAKKNFDIPHPSKKGWRLRHTCTEAPYNDVYVRGRLRNEKEIILPFYWKDFVHEDSITVNITPIGAYQNIFVKAITKEKIILDSNPMIPIHCFYQVFATRSDGEDLIPEYKGNSPEDYPGNNEEYIINK